MQCQFHCSYTIAIYSHYLEHRQLYMYVHVYTGQPFKAVILARCIFDPCWPGVNLHPHVYCIEVIRVTSPLKHVSSLDNVVILGGKR